MNNHQNINLREIDIIDYTDNNEIECEYSPTFIKKTTTMFSKTSFEMSKTEIKNKKRKYLIQKIKNKIKRFLCCY